MREVYIGADHRGFGLKEKLIIGLRAKGWIITDLNDKYDPSDDYPDIAVTLGEKVTANKTLGVLICASGAGMCAAVNKVKGIRAALAMTSRQARVIRNDDDINVLCLSADFVNESDNLEIAEEFLKATFVTEERFIRRIEKIKKYENA